MAWTLEAMLEHDLGFGLRLSPLQRAVARVVEGRSLGALAQRPEVVAALGGDDAVATLASLGRVRELALVAAIRSGKSLLVAGVAVHSSLHADLSSLGPGEVARFPVISLTRDLAKVIFEKVVGHVQESPVLRTFLARPPTATTVTLRRPVDGRLTEITVTAGARAGGSLVGRWLTGLAVDEYARMTGDASEGVINWAESVRAARERVRPGGSIVHTSAPHGPFGPAYTHVTEHHGRPTRQLVVVHAPGWDMYPAYWTPERVEAAKGTDAYVTDVAAQFATLEEALISSDLVERAMRPDAAPEPPREGASYVACIDPATRGNAWTLLVFTREGDATRCVLAREWIGSRVAPLSPKAVLAEIAESVAPYRIRSLRSDQWSADALNDLARDAGVYIEPLHWTERERYEAYQRIRNALERGRLSLPRVAHLREDLARVRRRVTRTGASVDLPVTSDGRHCDYAPALALGLAAYIPDYAEPPTHAQRTRDERRALARRQFGEDDRPRWAS
jgi:hypothetical protein